MITLSQIRGPFAAVLLGCISYAPVSSAQISEVLEVFRSGDTEAALVMLDELRQTYPDDVDYMLLRAQIYTQQGRESLALDELREATGSAPDYEDPWRLRHTLLQRAETGHYEAERLAVQQQVESRFPDADWWQAAATLPVVQWTILVGAHYDRLDNGAPSWNRQFIEVSREDDSSGRHRLAVSRDARFASSDSTVLVGSDFSIADHWLAGFDYSRAFSPRFLPDAVIGTYVGRSYANGWVTTLGYRHRSFTSVNVGTATLTTERYVGAFRFAYSLNASRLAGADTSLGHSFTSNWYYNDRSSVGLSISNGTEAEAVGPGQVLESRVRSIALSGRRTLNDRFGLQWWLGVHDQGDFYRRQFLGMAVSIKL